MSPVGLSQRCGAEGARLHLSLCPGRAVECALLPSLSLLTVVYARVLTLCDDFASHCMVPCCWHVSVRFKWGNPGSSNLSMQGFSDGKPE
ncbi:uncharacterized protein BDV14DRAFT_182770 [Aspergillus stella-maris]|uniref:uncharacterized protein n=1 Tax=Aspergillus stella-maris TaxID=1810926 RepID=UPI003CCD6938